MPYDTREEAQKEYTLKIPQHHHCRKCGNAFVGEDLYCSDECKKTDGEQAKKSLKKYLVVVAVLWAVTIGVIVGFGL